MGRQQASASASNTSRKTPMGRQGLIRSFQFESQHRVSYPHLTVSVKECVWQYTFYIRAQRALCFRGMRKP